ncbi:MAG: RNA polymerase sigma factor, partial [Spirochaetota bacterium]
RPETRDDEILLTIAGDEGPEDQALSGHFLARLFGQEPDSTKTMAVLHYVDGLTLEETAHRVGMSVSGVRKRLRQLRKRGLELKDL